VSEKSRNPGYPEYESGLKERDHFEDNIKKVPRYTLHKGVSHKGLAQGGV
jgi:hypothetical protein